MSIRGFDRGTRSRTWIREGRTHEQTEGDQPAGVGVLECRVARHRVGLDDATKQDARAPRANKVISRKPTRSERGAEIRRDVETDLSGTHLIATSRMTVQ